MSGCWQIGEDAAGVTRVRFRRGGDIADPAAELRHELAGRSRRVLLAEELQDWPPLGAEPLLGAERMPVVASVGGQLPAHALPELLEADVRIGAEPLELPIADRDGGVLVDPRAIARLSALAGGAASYWVLSRRRLDGPEALRGGLLDELTTGTAEALAAVALAAATRIAAGAPLALEYAKEALRRGARQSLPEGIEVEADLYSILQTTADRREGVEAFLEGRPPSFRGE